VAEIHELHPTRKGLDDDQAFAAAKGRKPNEAYRVREHLTEAEMAKLLEALRRNRHGQRDWLIGLLIYRHGLRVSEACDLRWDDIDLAKRTIIVRRLKGSNDSTHYLERDELAGLKALQRDYAKHGAKSAYVFVNARGQPFGRMGIGRMIERAGEAAKLPFGVLGQPRDGYAPAATLPWPRQHNEHGTLYRNVTGAF
jgi:integrase